LDAGAKTAYRIDNADEMAEEWLEGAETVGVTSGASVPESLVQGVLERLSSCGYEDVEIVTAAEESLIFSLPKELRRDLKAAGSDV
jgi:4-hydroxy-3-methylbut-2-enyl diphosphate reductase